MLASAMTTILAYSQARNNLFQQKQDKLLAIVSNAALQINGDKHSLLKTAKDMELDAYRELQKDCFAIASTDSEILYVYTMRKDAQNNIYFVLDAGHEPGATAQEYQPVEIGTYYDSPSDLLLENFETMDKPIVEPDFYTDEFGTYLTAYTPIYNSDGSVEAIIGIDILAQGIVNQQAQFYNTLLTLFTLTIILSGILGWFGGGIISRPLLALTSIVSNINRTRKKIEYATGINEIRQLFNHFNTMIDSLNENEEKIKNQAAVLDLQNEKLQLSLEELGKRARQFEAIAQVARATITNESWETFLPRLTSLISERFGFYHAGIFLLDEERQYAVLRAANSEGGRRMLNRGHRLQIGQTGIVGFVSATGMPRIALDVGDDAVYFDNPDLPNTRSEIALPLRIADEVIGVLDVQSIASNAFQEEDVEVLSTLADQVAIAIQNARSYETMQELLKEAQKVTGAYRQDAWRILQTEETGMGYRVSGDAVDPLTRPLTSLHVRKAVREKQTVAEGGKNASLAIPIRLRDEVIGVMDIRTQAEHEWDADEIDIAEAVADRLSLALETSLLLRSTQRRAEIERITADISGKIGATTQFDSILRTAAEELSRVLGGSEVLVQIQSPDTGSGN
jgi:GAF domain-containing protein